MIPVRNEHKMKFSKLKTIVNKSAHDVKESNAYMGGHGDGGSSAILRKLSEFENTLIHKLDLRPSEYCKLNNEEVGEPQQFLKEITEYREYLSKNIEL